MMKEIRVGLIGFGTVGKGLAATLLQQKDRLRQRVGAAVTLKRVADIHLRAFLKNTAMSFSPKMPRIS